MLRRRRCIRRDGRIYSPIVPNLRGRGAASVPPLFSFVSLVGFCTLIQVKCKGARVCVRYGMHACVAGLPMLHVAYLAGASLAWSSLPDQAADLMKGWLRSKYQLVSVRACIGIPSSVGRLRVQTLTSYTEKKSCKVGGK